MSGVVQEVVSRLANISALLPNCCRRRAQYAPVSPTQPQRDSAATFSSVCPSEGIDKGETMSINQSKLKEFVAGKFLDNITELADVLDDLYELVVSEGYKDSNRNSEEEAQIIDKIRGCFDNSEFKNREAAYCILMSLSSYSNNDLIEAVLINIVKNNSYDDAILRGLRSLSKFTDIEVIEAVKDKISHSDVDIRCAAYSILAKGLKTGCFSSLDFNLEGSEEVNQDFLAFNEIGKLYDNGSKEITVTVNTLDGKAFTYGISPYGTISSLRNNFYEIENFEEVNPEIHKESNFVLGTRKLLSNERLGTIAHGEDRLSVKVVYSKKPSLAEVVSEALSKKCV